MRKTAMLFLLATGGLSCGGDSERRRIEYGENGPNARNVEIRVSLEPNAFGAVTIYDGPAWIVCHVWPDRSLEQIHDALARGGVTRFERCIGSYSAPNLCEWVYRGDPDTLKLEVSGVGVYAELMR
jgi:hypothetical protein